jgi:hypothetical protein
MGSTVVARRAGKNDAKRHGHQDDGHREERRRIGGVDLEEEAGHQARQKVRADEPERETRRDERHRLPQDEAQDGARLRPQRHPDAELLAALADGERHDSGDTGAGDGESEGREERQERRGQPGRRERVRARLVESLEAVDRLVRIDGVNRTHGPGERQRSPDPDEEASARRVCAARRISSGGAAARPYCRTSPATRRW